MRRVLSSVNDDVGRSRIFVEVISILIQQQQHIQSRRSGGSKKLKIGYARGRKYAIKAYSGGDWKDSKFKRTCMNTQ
nr:hypothetical protein [Tanacetum cinerariifolium]